jgi:hypothetical protein
MDKAKTQEVVREAYGKIARNQQSRGCGPCELDTIEFAKSIGYSAEELKAIPLRPIWLLAAEIRQL